MLLVKPWWDFCTEFIVSIRNWRHQFRLEMENRRRQLKEPYGEKDQSAGWVLLTGFEKSHLPTACFTHWKKERKYHAASCVLVICCLTSNAYHAGYALSTTRLLAASRDVFLIPKISHIIRHCKFVSQSACIFLKKNPKTSKRQVLLKLEKKTRRRKKLSLKRVFYKLDNNRWKMHTGARARKQKYISIYISLCMKTFLKTGVYIYIYMYIYTPIFKKVFI